MKTTALEVKAQAERRGRRADQTNAERALRTINIHNSIFMLQKTVAAECSSFLCEEEMLLFHVNADLVINLMRFVYTHWPLY